MTASITAAAPNTDSSAAVRGAPRVVLRVEGALVLAAALTLYQHLDGSWAWFAALFLVPDASMLGYLLNARTGAALYNAGHSYLAPALIAIAGYALGTPALLFFAIIWAAHVGFDRALGYGLKYGSRFADTHLGAVGRGA